MKPRLMIYATPAQQRILKALKLVTGAANYTDAIENVAERLAEHDMEFRARLEAAIRAMEGRPGE